MNIMLAMPCYGGKMYSSTARSVINLIITLITKNIQYEFFVVDADSLITRARNCCVAKFLSSKCTHLLFIDSDISFEPFAILRLIDSGHDICGCAYPRKTMNWDKIKENMNNSNTPYELMIKSSDYVCSIEPSNIENGWIEAKEIGTGLMMIKREVFNNLIHYFPDLKYTNDILSYNEFKDYFYTFFDCKCINDRYLSEDYYFCYLCKKIGYKIMLDTVNTIYHTGNYSYPGNMLDTIMLKLKN